MEMALLILSGSQDQTKSHESGKGADRYNNGVKRDRRENRECVDGRVIRKHCIYV